MKKWFLVLGLCSVCFSMMARAENAPIQKQEPVGEIKLHSLEDSRGDFMPGLKVELSLPPVWANSYRYMEDPVVTQAVDNLGVNLIKDKAVHSSKTYDFHDFKDKERLDLFNPSRPVTSVSIKGYICNSRYSTSPPPSSTATPSASKPIPNGAPQWQSGTGSNVKILTI